MKGAIFDIDGTILDSMTVWLDITNEFFKEHNVNVSKNEIMSYQSMSFEESIVKIHTEYIKDMSVEEMFEEFSARAEQAYAQTLPAKPGVCEYIHSLHRSGVKLAVATSGFKKLAEAALRRLGVFECFSAFAYSSETGCSKSQPDIYLLAAERIDEPPEDCVVFEDIITGIKSASSAGFKTVAIEDPTNFADRKSLKKHANIYITDWHELLYDTKKGL